MPDTFQILAKFLERFGDEVEGRALQELPKDAQASLQRLARGTLPEEDQAGLFALLNKNPAWVGWLAQEVKALRHGDASMPNNPE